MKSRIAAANSVAASRNYHDSQGGFDIMKKFLFVAVLATALAAFFAVTSNIASAATDRTAAPATSQWQGWCGGPAASVDQLLDRWQFMGASGSMAAHFGVSPVNDNLSNWAHRNVGIATVARSITLQANWGCSRGELFGAHLRTLKRGDKAFVNKTPLRSTFPNGFSFSPRPGWSRKIVCLEGVANPTCSNPIRVRVCVWVWVPVPIKAPPPKKKPQPTPPLVTVSPVLTKTWWINGVAQSVPEAQVQFNVSDNGKAVNTVTNPVPGATRPLGSFAVGHNICVQELGIPSNSVYAGFMPDSGTICHTFSSANDTFKFEFRNVKNVSVVTIPPVVQSPCAVNQTQSVGPNGQIVCTANTTQNTTTTVSCNGQQTAIKDSNGVVVLCLNITNVNNNTNNDTNNNNNTCNGQSNCGTTPPCAAPNTVVNGVCTAPAPTPCPAGTTGTPPNCVSPPPVVTLVLSNLTAPQNGPNGVYADGGRYPNLCVTVQGKAGNTVKLAWSAVLGHMESNITSVASTGADHPCDGVYIAPLDAAAVGKTETICVSGTDVTANVNSTGINGGPNPCVSFVLQAPPPRP